MLGKSRMLVGLVLFGGAVAAIVGMRAGFHTAWSQEKDKTTTAEKTGDAGAVDGFAKLSAEWKALVKEQRKIQQDFRFEKDAKKRDEQRAAFQEKSTQIRAKLPALGAAAETAFAAQPKDAELRDFLMLLAGFTLGTTDDYDRVGRWSDLLIKNGTLTDDQRASIYGLGATAALEHLPPNFDKAKAHIDELAKGRQGDPAQASALKERMEKEKAYWQKEAEIRAAEEKAAADPATALPQVKLVVKGKGEVVLELFENEAPNTVANFISLVKSGFYNGLTFHRVLPQFVIQGGCNKGDGSGGPPGNYKIACECYEKKKVGDKEEPIFRRHFRGSLSMAHSGPDTGGSQFFLCLAGTTSDPVRNLDAKFDADGKPSGGHTVFGRVVSGFDVMAKIQRRDPSKKESNVTPDRIESATVLRSRKANHDYVPKKVGETAKKETGNVPDSKKTDEKSSTENKTPEKKTTEKKTDEKAKT